MTPVVPLLYVYTRTESHFRTE